MSQVHSNSIKKTELLITGLRRNKETLENKGIDEQLITKLEISKNQSVTYEKEKDALRAELKAKTLQAMIRMNEISSLTKQIKQIIKKNYDQSKWADFGIMDKK